MELVIRVQILNVAVNILLPTNALEKGINPPVFSPAMSK